MAAMLGAVEDPNEFMEGCPHQLPASGWTQAIVTYGGAFGTSVWIQKDYVERVDYWASQYGVPVDELTAFFKTLVDTPPQRWRDLSGLSEDEMRFLKGLPPYWIDGSEPPFLLIHGENDALDSAEPEAFEALLQAAGVDAKLLMLPNAGHQDIRDDYRSGFEAACQAIEAFMVEVLE
jgi:dipeptidyl aminopeptidase/acylaminoacyl peptidase